MPASYNPSLPDDLNRMRFELGDVVENDFFLQDEEIIAALEGRSFKRAQLYLLDSLLARFSYETDLRVDKWEAKFSQRLDAWQRLRKKLTDDLALEETNPFGFKGKNFRPPIFTLGMHDWRK